MNKPVTVKDVGQEVEANLFGSNWTKGKLVSVDAAKETAVFAAGNYLGHPQEYNLHLSLLRKVS